MNSGLTVVILLSVLILLNVALKLDRPKTKKRPFICSYAQSPSTDTVHSANETCSTSTNTSSIYFDRIIVVGDVHGDLNGLLEVLFHANLTSSPDSCSWKPQTSSVLLVQMGDIVDRGPQATEAWECLSHLQSSASEGGKVVRLIGNHELYWLQGYVQSRNKSTDSPAKIMSLVRRIKEDILANKAAGSHLLTLQSGLPLLFTHAGIRPEFQSYLTSMQVQSPDQMVEYVNGNLVQAMGSCKVGGKCPLEDEVYQAGDDRGGHHIGGPYWTDFSALEEADNGKSTFPAVQVVGHTMAFCFHPKRMGYHPRRDELECDQGLIRKTIHMSAICTDGGMYAGARAYLEILNGQSQFIAREKERDGSWSERNLAAGVC